MVIGSLIPVCRDNLKLKSFPKGRRGRARSLTMLALGQVLVMSP